MDGSKAPLRDSRLGRDTYPGEVVDQIANSRALILVNDAFVGGSARLHVLLMVCTGVVDLCVCDGISRGERIWGGGIKCRTRGSKSMSRSG